MSNGKVAGVGDISETLLAELRKHIVENEKYEVQVVSMSENGTCLIRIPAVYEKIKIN